MLKVRAYGRSAQVMLEVSNQWPEHFCSRMQTDLFVRGFRAGSAPLIWGEIVDGMADQSNVVFNRVMERYIDIGSQEAAFLYVHDASGNVVRDPITNRPLYHPEVIRKLGAQRNSW